MMHAVHSCNAGGEGEDPMKGMRAMFGPMGADQAVRQAISTCWMMLPEDKKSIDALETEIRRLVDRALKDLKEDAQSFGITA